MDMALADNLRALRLPLMAAPMSFASSLELVIACCRSGVIGAYQGANPRGIDEFRRWLIEIEAAKTQAREEGRPFAPYAVNLLASAAHEKSPSRERLDICEEFRVPLLISSVGDPHDIAKRVHGWGGAIFHDVTTVEFAKKAAAAGVDGIMLCCAGAGGHAGALSPFTFIRQVRSFFDGTLVAAGGIAEGAGMAAAIALGADMVAMGTRFIATKESGVQDDYKHLLTEAQTADCIFTDAIAGLGANFLRQSIERGGLDPKNLPRPPAPHRGNLPDGVRAWRDVWSAGHSVGLIHDVPTVAEVVERLQREYVVACGKIHPPGSVSAPSASSGM
jgi:nitronate monooxygenase